MEDKPLWKKVLLAGVNAICVFILVMVALALLAFFPFSQAFGHVFFRLLTGFYWFLGENLPRMSVNRDVLVPGVTAFLMAAAMIHWLGKSWASKRNRAWSAGVSISLVALLPILFATAFLVPGALLQGKLLLGEERLLQGRGSEAGAETVYVRNHAQALLGRMHMENLDRFPDSLKSDYLSSYGTELIYPAAGLPADLDDSFPMLISRPYRTRAGEHRRRVVPVNGEMFEIPADDVDVWLDKAREMRRKMEEKEPAAE